MWFKANHAVYSRASLTPVSTTAVNTWQKACGIKESASTIPVSPLVCFPTSRSCAACSPMCGITQTGRTLFKLRDVARRREIPIHLEERHVPPWLVCFFAQAPTAGPALGTAVAMMALAVSCSMVEAFSLSTPTSFVHSSVTGAIRCSTRAASM